MKPLGGAPGYKPGFDGRNLDTYKSAFNESWSEAQQGYNAIVAMNRSFKLKEQEIVPLLHVDGTVGITAGGLNAVKSFTGAKLKPELSKVDSRKVNGRPELREQLLAATDRTNSSERAMANQRGTIEQVNGQVLQACNSLAQAFNNIEIAEIEGKLGDAQLDKERVRRDLEDYKADIKAAVEGAKFFSAVWGAVSNPTKVFDLFNQSVNTGGAVAERQVTHDANKSLAAFDQTIRRFQHRKSSLQVENAMKVHETALLALREKLIEVHKQGRLMQDRKEDYARAYRDKAKLMAQAGEASGMKGKDSKALAAAVEAMPKLEAISQELEGMDAGVVVPSYNEASGIGAAMCSNVGAFTHAVSVVKGNKTYIAELKALWEGRRASVQMVMDKALSVEGTEW